MSYRNQRNSNKEYRRNNKEINIDCENYNNGDAVRVNNGSSNMNTSFRSMNTSFKSMNTSFRSENGGIGHSNSQHTLFESTPDNSSFRVVKSYREYAAQGISDDDSDSTDGPGITNADNTSFGHEYSQSKNNKSFDLYREQSEGNLKNNIDYDDFEKTRTIKSSSTSSSNRTAYKNPTLSSVVNQNLQNSSFDKNYFEQQYENMKENQKIDPKLKLQKMILNVPETYDIPTRNKKILSQRILNVTLIIMIIIATTLLALFIYLKLNHGYSFPHIKDINDDNRTKMIFISLFMYLAVIVGSVGSALNWKSILVTYCIFCSLNTLALGYLVYGVYDDAYKYSRLPFAWWETYSTATRRTLQDYFECCGFHDPLDGGEISNYCPKEAVVWNIPYETIYDPFSLMKKDACSKDLNTIIVNPKNKVKLPTPVIGEAPDFAVNSRPTNNLINNEEINVENMQGTNVMPKAYPMANYSPPVSTPIPTPNLTNFNKRSFEIEEAPLEIQESPLFAKNIYNIMSYDEVEEEDDQRDDREISSIRILNKRHSYILENVDQYQARINGTNASINPENLNTNYTAYTPEQSLEFAKNNGIGGCKEKLHNYIHKSIVPVFYVLLVFFCLYIITIPVALIFLFKLRTIPSINEFE